MKVSLLKLFKQEAIQKKVQFQQLSKQESNFKAHDTRENHTEMGSLLFGSLITIQTSMGHTFFPVL